MRPVLIAAFAALFAANSIFANAAGSREQQRNTTLRPRPKGDERLAAGYPRRLKEVSIETKTTTFVNVIRKEGRCGVAASGEFDTLWNTDRENRYIVTVRTNWTHGIEHGTRDDVVTNEAGGKHSLGCTRSGNIDTEYYYREVVGERKSPTQSRRNSAIGRSSRESTARANLL